VTEPSLDELAVAAAAGYRDAWPTGSQPPLRSGSSSSKHAHSYSPATPDNWMQAMADIEVESTRFQATLVRWPGAGGWVFAPVPDQYAPDTAGPFGRVPVMATVDERTWATSVWRDKTAGWLLPVPARIRQDKDHGDPVHVTITIDRTRL
jgi:Domain of unknown function (DUF1905)